MKLKITIVMMLLSIIIIDLEMKNNKLEKENHELNQQIIDYKWQLEQVPLVIESNKEEICK